MRTLDVAQHAWLFIFHLICPTYGDLVPCHLKHVTQAWPLGLKHREEIILESSEGSEEVDTGANGGKKRLYVRSEHSSPLTVGASDT